MRSFLRAKTKRFRIAAWVKTLPVPFPGSSYGPRADTLGRPATLRGALTHLGASADVRIAHALGVTLTAAGSMVPWLVAIAMAPVLAFYALKDAQAVRERV